MTGQDYGAIGALIIMMLIVVIGLIEGFMERK